MNERVVFARVGWMVFYGGSQPGDERPIGGGSWNHGEMGHEIYNFKPVKGTLYGFVESRSSRLNIRRIDSASSGQVLEPLTVVWVATNPQSGGQWIVGWYRQGVAYESYQLRPGHDQHFLFEGKANHSCLLPLDWRRFRVPSGKGGFGQANVFYPLDERGHRKKLSWITNALSYISEYEGPNLLSDPQAATGQSIADAFEFVKASIGGQGFGGTPQERQAIEKHSMKRAEKYFATLGFECDPSVHKTKSYDILCTKRSGKLFVEVKGTRGGANSVLLTRGEVSHVINCEELCALYVLYGVKIGGSAANPRAIGGKERVLYPWKLDRSALNPTAYEYRLPAT